MDGARTSTVMPSTHGTSPAPNKPPSAIHTATQLKAGKPARINVHPFSTFQSSETKQNLSSPVRRKPLPPSASASPVVPRFSSGGELVAVGAEESTSAAATSRLRNSPPGPHHPPWLPPLNSFPTLIVRDLDQFPRGHSPHIPQSPGSTPFSDLPADAARQVLQNLDNSSRSPPRVIHSQIASHNSLHGSSAKPPSHGGQKTQQANTLSIHTDDRPAIIQSRQDMMTQSHRANEFHESLPAARSNMLTSFFGWKGAGSSPISESSPTTISDRSHSPGLSPRNPSPRIVMAKGIPGAIDTRKANAILPGSYFAHTGHPQPPLTPAISIKVEELEEELREISSELAASIRREMELEDEVDRLQMEGPSIAEPYRRTSDYFSDSGTSSVRYPPSDENSGSRSEDVSKLKRRSEQEKAQIKLETSQKLTEERARRRAMEDHIRKMEEHVQDVERNQARIVDPSGRVQELEAALEDNRRRLQEERQLKENYEDLLSALREEIENHRSERDNLRNEVVPQLRSRVEGLEAEATEFQRLTYENTRMQQELQSLRSEGSHMRSPRYSTIAEESSLQGPQSKKNGLTRSSSVARGMSSMGGLARSGSLSRSNSISKERESRESLADRVKEIELQRDALHRALRSLLERQKYQNAEHIKRIKALEIERDRALEGHSPRRRGYEKEVTGLRYEINQLRKRADDALEQKWQCEKGLGGLKKDLDRAEQETGSLRKLLQENDISIPFTDGNTPSDHKLDAYPSSFSLERAYKELQATQALSLARLRDIKGIVPSDSDDALTKGTMDVLLMTMSNAEAERDFAQKQVETYRAQAASLQETTSFHESENANLAEQLHASANRVEALASQVRFQLESNSGLRQRLAEAVGRGEREQKASAARINNMQGRLKSLEERLMAAQQHSEEAVQHHEDEVKDIREGRGGQLHRFRIGIRSPNPPLVPTPNMGARLSPRSPRSPMFQGIRSPKLDRTSTGAGMSMNEALRTEFLERRVADLERALAEADREMQEVVQRMNKAQIEVLELQSARDDAMRKTKTLQTQIMTENAKVGSLMRYFS